MISNPGLVFYACIARGTVILADFNNEESNLDDLPFRCIQKAPPNHSIYSHTVRKRAYTFLIEGTFVYFGIFHEDVYKSEVYAFLNRLKQVFEEFMESESVNDFENLGSNCFQSRLDSSFRQLVGSNLNKTVSSRLRREGSLNSSGVVMSKLSNANRLVKKKKKVDGDGNGNGNGEGSVDVYEENNGVMSRDITLVMQRNGSHVERQKAKQIWQKHVWVVLSLDLFVCLVLFAVWLWVCRGFQCIES